jgi:hypothetical protein
VCGCEAHALRCAAVSYPMTHRIVALRCVFSQIMQYLNTVTDWQYDNLNSFDSFVRDSTRTVQQPRRWSSVKCSQCSIASNAHLGSPQCNCLQSWRSCMRIRGDHTAVLLEAAVVYFAAYVSTRV